MTRPDPAFTKSSKGAKTYLCLRATRPEGHENEGKKLSGGAVALPRHPPRRPSPQQSRGGTAMGGIENGLPRRPHPNRTGGSPASGFPVRGSRWTGSGTRLKASGRVAPAAQACAPLTCFTGGPLSSRRSHSRPGFPVHPGAKPCGTTRTLLGWSLHGSQHHVPAPFAPRSLPASSLLREALTPTGPSATGRGSLIHVTRTSDHSCLQPSAVLRQTRSTPSTLAALFCSGFALSLAGSPEPPTESSSPSAPQRRPVVTDWSFTFSCFPPGGYRPGAVTFGYWPYSVGQVRDSHPAVQVRSQAHKRRPSVVTMTKGWKPFCNRSRIWSKFMLSCRTRSFSWQAGT